MLLPDYKSQVLPSVQSGSGVVRQRPAREVGPYLSLAESQGLRDSMTRDQYEQQLRRAQNQQGGVAGQGIMQAATIIAAAIGAYNVAAAGAAAGATEAAAVAGSAETIVATEGTMASAAGATAKAVTDAALVPEAVVSTADAGSKVVEAMFRQAFPTISNAYDYGAKLAGRTIGSGENTQAVSRHMADRQIIDAEIAKMMQTSQPEDYDKNINEIFNEVMGEAKFGASKLSKGAYEAYYASMQDYENVSRKNVIQDTAKKIYSDRKNLTNSLIELEISRFDENDPDHTEAKTQENINRLLEEGMNGNPNEENSISVYTPDEVASKQLQIGSSLRVAKAKNHLLSNHSYQGAVNSLLNQNNYTYLTSEERNGLIDEFSNLATVDQKSKDAASAAALTELENLEWQIRDGPLNLEDELKRLDPYMNLGHKREARAYFSAYVDNPSGEKDAANSELGELQRQFSNNLIDANEYTAGFDDISIKYPNAVSVDAIRAAHDDAARKKLVPTIKTFTDSIDSLKNDKGESFLTGAQIEAATSRFMDLTNTEAFRSLTDDQQRMAIASITDDIINSEAVSGKIDLGLGHRIGDRERLEDEKYGRFNKNDEIEDFIEQIEDGAHMGSWDRYLDDIAKVGPQGEAFVTSKLNKSPTKYLENGGWVYVVPEYNEETHLITQKEYYIDIVDAGERGGREPKLIAIDSPENTSPLHQLQGRIQNGYVPPVVHKGEVLSEGAMIVNGQRQNFDIANAYRVKSPFAKPGEVSNVFAFPIITAAGKRKSIYFEIDETNQRSYPMPDPTPYLKAWGYPGLMDDYFAAKRERGN